MMVLTQAYLEWEQQTEQRGRQEGEQVGILKGRDEGAFAEAQSFVLRLLSRRIGDISPNVKLQIESLSVSQLESLGEALLDFSHSDDLVRWLGSHF